MTVNAKIETILKNLNKGINDPVTIFSGLLKNLLPPEPHSFTHKTQPAQTEEALLVKAMYEILKTTKSIERALKLLNDRYSKIGKKKLLDRSQSFAGPLQSASPGSEEFKQKNSQRLLYPTFSPPIPKKSSPISRDKSESINDFQNLSDVVIAFLCVFEEYHSAVKPEVEVFLKISIYKNIWQSYAIQHVEGLLSHITGESNAVKRCELIERLDISIQWLPVKNREAVEKILLEEATSKGINGYSALAVILKLKNQLSKTTLKGVLEEVIAKFEIYASDSYDHIVFLCNVFKNLSRYMKTKEEVATIQIKVESLIIALMENMHTTQNLQMILVTLSEFLSYSRLQQVIGVLRDNLQSHHDEIVIGAMHALTQLLPQLNKFIRDEETAATAFNELSLMMNDIISLLKNPHALIECTAHEELMKFKKHVASFDSENYFNKLFKVMNDVKSPIELRRSCMRGIVHLINDARSFQQVLTTLKNLLQNDEELEIQIECIRVLAALKNQLRSNALENIEVIKLILQCTSNSVLVPEVCDALVTLKSIMTLELQKEARCTLIDKLFDDKKEINKNIYQALHEYHDREIDDAFDQKISEMLLVSAPNDRKIEVCDYLCKLYEFLSVEKRKEIAVYLVDQLKLCHLERIKSTDDKKSKGNHIDENEVGSLEIAYLKTLTIYAFSLSHDSKIPMMNYLRMYIADKNVAELEAQSLYLQMYLSYRQHFVISMFNKIKKLLLFSKGEIKKTQEVVFEPALANEILSYRT